MDGIILLLFILLLQGLTIAYVYWRLQARQVLPPSEVGEMERELVRVASLSTQPLTKEIFVTFPCGNCTEQIVVEDHLLPGDIHVVDCPNCKTSWSIYNPSLIIKQTKELPDSLKTAVAQNMAELNA